MKVVKMSAFRNMAFVVSFTVFPFRIIDLLVEILAETVCRYQQQRLYQYQMRVLLDGHKHTNLIHANHQHPIS
jgi:hypothetical protein